MEQGHEVPTKEGVFRDEGECKFPDCITNYNMCKYYNLLIFVKHKIMEKSTSNIYVDS